MDAKATWRKGLLFTGIANSGFQIPLGSSDEPGAESTGAGPLELVLVGLAGCTSMDVVSILEKKRQDVTAFEVRTHADRATDYPKIFTHILIEYVITGRHIDRPAAERAVELSMTKYCPVVNMLNKAARIETKITLIEANN